MACALSQDVNTDPVPEDVSAEGENVSNAVTVATDTSGPSDDNPDAENEEIGESDLNPIATSENQTEKSTKTGSSETDNEENASPSDNSSTNNGDEVSKVTTSASPVEGGDSSNSIGETDESNNDNFNPSTENNEDSATTTPSDETPEQPSSPVTAAPTTSAPTPEFTCQSVGRFPHPDSCEKYYFCWDTIHSYAVFSCPKVFDPVSKRCVDNYAVCPLAPTCETDKQVLPFPDDKTAYFECKLEKDKNAVTPVYEIRKEECEKGREFDSELGYCRLITSTEWTSSESGSSERFECNGIGTYIDYSSETHYIECVIKSVCKGILKAVRRKCPKYTVFSAVDKQCIPL